MSDKKEKTVYVGITGDIIHPGIINIIQQGAKYGRLIVGLLTNSAIATHKRIPYLTYEQRKQVLENIKGVDIKSTIFDVNLQIANNLVELEMQRENVNYKMNNRILKYFADMVSTSYEKGTTFLNNTALISCITPKTFFSLSNKGNTNTDCV